MSTPHTLLLVNTFANKDADRLIEWRGDLKTTTVRDLHVWMVSQGKLRKLRSFNLLARHSVGTSLTLVYQGAWTQTLADAGVVHKDMLFVSGEKDQLPRATSALSALRLDGGGLSLLAALMDSC